MEKLRHFTLAFALFLIACPAPPRRPTIPVVPTPDAEAELLAAIQRAGVRDTLFGVGFDDPFRAFDTGSPDVEAWRRLATTRGLDRPVDAALAARIAELDAMPRVLDAYVAGAHAVVEEMRRGRRVWVYRGPEGERMLDDGVHSAAIDPEGRLALLIAGDDDTFVLRIAENEIAGVAPVAPVWDGDTLLYAAYPAAGEPGYDVERSAPRVRRREPSGEETVVFDQARPGDVLRIGTEDEVTWYELRRGEQREIFLEREGTLHSLPSRRVGTGPRLAQGRVWLADDEAIYSAPVVHAHEPAAWERVEVAVLELGRVGGDIVALMPGIVSEVRVVRPTGLGEALPVPLGEIRALRDEWIVWTDPLTPPTLIERGDEGWSAGSRCRLVRRRASVAASLGEATRWVVEAQGALGMDASLAFRPGVAAWIERGGGWVLVDVPGGGGFGSAQHRRARGAGKDAAVRAYQRVLEDPSFEGAHVFAYGRGHGAILAASVLGEGLVSGVLLHDPVTDLIGALRSAPTDQTWVGEYGALSDASSVRRLLELSPYHRVVEGRHAPTWVEVDPRARIPDAHGAKLAARLALGGSTWFVDQRATSTDRWARSVAFLELVSQ